LEFGVKIPMTANAGEPRNWDAAWRVDMTIQTIKRESESVAARIREHRKRLLDE